MICPPDQHTATEIPAHLLREIKRGNVVAFVGAGFSRAAKLPVWGELLRGLVDESQNTLGDDAALICELAKSSQAQDLDLAAQILVDKLGKRGFEDGIRRKLTVDHTTLTDEMKTRLQHLHGIPFAAILTTNFDNLLEGTDVQNAKKFGEFASSLLRNKPSQFERLERTAFALQSTPILKLHGDVSQTNSSLVCTREGYRELLHGNSRYVSFVRTILATHVVLFIGFSFTDDYINALRSEVVTMFSSQHKDPLAYAIFHDCHPSKQQALHQHDGLKVLNFSSNGGTDFSGFDRILAELYAQTNPTLSIGRQLHQRNIIWMHQSWETATDSPFLKQFLENANSRAVGHLTCSMIVVPDAKSCLDAIRAAPCDAVISVFDTRAQLSGEGSSTAGSATFELLDSLRSVPMPPPVLVIGGYGKDYSLEKRVEDCIRRGARCYTYKFWELLENLAQLMLLVPAAKQLRSSQTENGN